VRRLAGLLAVPAAILAAAGGASAEQLTVALSANDVMINSNFTGIGVTVFGAIERDATAISRPPYDVAIVVSGPPQTVVARRQDRVLGVWANSASETLVDVPSFYAMNSSRPLAAVATGPFLKHLGLGFENIAFTYATRRTVNDPEAAEFRDAFVRLKGEAGLYAETTNAVTFLGSSIFRTTVWIPANVPVGLYTVSVYLFGGEVLLAEANDKITVSKTGFERFMFGFAHSQALIYGLACVALALFTGWLGGVIFRRD
jgi:uncharacterized protein (TIGR02186 family)